MWPTLAVIFMGLCVLLAMGHNDTCKELRKAREDNETYRVYLALYYKDESTRRISRVDWDKLKEAFKPNPESRTQKTSQCNGNPR